MIRSASSCWGITWERAISRRRGLLRRTAAIVAAGLAGTFAGVLPANASVTPLPDLASVEQVVGAPAAWQAGATGTGVDVAVLDTGVTPVPGLNGPNKILFGPDLSFDSQDPNAAYLDNFGHGTAIASIIAGNDGVPGGFQGVAPNARIVSVKVGSRTGAVDVSQIIAGIDWVVQHAHDPGVNIRVLNLSLGTTSTQPYTIDPLAAAAENAWKHGIAVVVSAGNDGTSGNAVADPATDPFVITVGAEDPNGTVTPTDDTVPGFSQRGNGSRRPDLVAPGANVMGLAVPGSTLATQFPNALFGGGRFIRGSGTSQAAAFVSGAVADMLSVNPSWTPDQVKAALASSAQRIANNNPNFVGAGLVNVAGAAAATPGSGRQYWAPALGTGSLEAARGNAHVAYNGVTLTGEQDIFGNPWVPAVMVPAAQACIAWNGGTYNNGVWTGTGFSSVTWSSVTWSSVTWSSVTWSSVTWSSVTWSSVTWSSALWASSDWA